MAQMYHPNVTTTANKTEMALCICVSRLCDPGIDHTGDHYSVRHPLHTQESLQGKSIRFREGGGISFQTHILHPLSVILQLS